MFCPICGKDNAETEAFCANCGNPLHRPAVTPQPQAVPSAPASAPFSGELPGKTQGLVGMILGIVSIVLGCCSPFITLPCGIAGIILSAISMRKAKATLQKNNQALAGLICAIIGVVLSLLSVALVVVALLMEYA